MNQYSELLDLLVNQPPAPLGCLATVASASPLALELDGNRLTENLHLASNLNLTEWDVGRTVALLPVSGGMVVLCRVE